MVTHSNRWLDDIDSALLDRLRVDGRATLADLGKRVGLSPPAVKRRVDRLEREGLIVGYTAIVDETKLGRGLEAFAQLTFVGTTKVDEIASVAEDMAEVEAVYTTAGDPDALVHLRVRDVAHLRAAIDYLRRSGNVTGTKTLIVLGTRTMHFNDSSSSRPRSLGAEAAEPETSGTRSPGQHEPATTSMRRPSGSRR